MCRVYREVYGVCTGCVQGVVHLREAYREIYTVIHPQGGI